MVWQKQENRGINALCGAVFLLLALEQLNGAWGG